MVYVYVGERHSEGCTFLVFSTALTYPMNVIMHSLLNVYKLIGRDDKAGLLEFVPGSDAYQEYGETLNVVLVYTQAEREELEAILTTGSAAADVAGHVKARYLGFDLHEEKRQKLLATGVNTADINSIYSANGPSTNTFHSEATRSVNPLVIPIQKLPKGGDYDWIYGFAKAQVAQGIGLTPHERDFYLAAKLYFEPAAITPEEETEMRDGDSLKAGVEAELLNLKEEREDITPEERERATVLQQEHTNRCATILEQALQDAGSSLPKLLKKSPEQATKLLLSVVMFEDRKLNVDGKIPIYLDLPGYLHVYMRHVKEMKVGKAFEDKDNFQWAEKDVLMVMENVIRQVEDEVQQHFAQLPDKRYRRYGSQSVYYQGDYYILYIEPDGRISTFFKSKRKRAAA